MNQKQIVIGLVSGGLSFAIGFVGGAVLNRPARLNYDSKIAKIRSESSQSEQTIMEKLRSAQAVVKGLERENRQLNNELRNMHTALAEAQQKKQNDNAKILRNDAIHKNDKNQSKYEESDEAWNLRIKDKLNLENISFKLGFLAIENDTIDTREYHNHLNKLKENHKFRLEVISQYDQLGGFAEPGIYETFLNGQEQIRQRKVEALKRKDIHSFDLIEEVEQQMYRDFLKTIKKNRT